VAAKVDDFKEAATKEGCEAIPYPTERQSCKDRSGDKDRICQGFTCNKEEINKDLDNYKEKRQNLENAKARKDEQSVRSLEETVKSLDEKLKQQKKLAKDRIDNGTDCLETRERVQRSFSDAEVMVQKETDPDLQKYIPDLVRKYKKGREEHIRPMQETTTAIEGCKWASQITW
jgi:hypothetical protein